MNINEFISELEKHDTEYMRFDYPAVKQEVIVVPVSTGINENRNKRVIQFIFKLNEKNGLMLLSSGVIYDCSFEQYMKNFVNNIIEFGGQDDHFIKNFEII